MSLTKNQRQYDVQTVTTQTAIAASGNGPTAGVVLPRPMNGIIFTLDVTSIATVAADKLDVYVRTMLNGSTWVRVVHFTQIDGNATAPLRYASIVHCNWPAHDAGSYIRVWPAGAQETVAENTVLHFLGDLWQAEWVITDDTTPLFDFSVQARPF